MTFTQLHRAVGAQPGPITSEMLDDLIAQGVEEGDELDFKKTPPDQKALAQSDIPKDIAAFANSGGGVLVFGMEEDGRKATSRVDVGDISEAFERTLRSIAVSHIHPPIFGLDLVKVGVGEKRALVVVVPASLDGPHLIYKGDYFGAPIRNHADTVWMRERQLEQMYRARFDARSRASSTLDGLYDETAADHSADERAWLVAVAVPRLPRVGPRPERQTMRAVIDAARETADSVDAAWVHPLESVDSLNPRRGMRRWVLHNSGRNWDTYEAWVSILDDGSVTVAMAVGGYPDSHKGESLPGGEVYGRTIECCVVDLLALVSAVGSNLGSPAEYDVKLGVEWRGPEPLLITTFDQRGYRYSDNSVPLAAFVPLRTSIRSDVVADDLQRQMYDVALDAVNQGGVQNLQIIADPDFAG